MHFFIYTVSWALFTTPHHANMFYRCWYTQCLLAPYPPYRLHLTSWSMTTLVWRLISNHRWTRPRLMQLTRRLSSALRWPKPILMQEPRRFVQTLTWCIFSFSLCLAHYLRRPIMPIYSIDVDILNVYSQLLPILLIGCIWPAGRWQRWYEGWF